MPDPHQPRARAASSLQKAIVSRQRAPFLALSLFALTSMVLSLTVCAGTFPASAPETETSRTRTEPGSEISVRLKVEGESGNLRSPWDLVLYLDGRPLVVVSPAEAPVELTCASSTGDHRLRVLRERHGTRPDGSPIHTAEVSDAFLDLHVAPDAGPTISALYRIREGDSDPPAASLELHRDPDREDSKATTSAEWELLCEELEVGRRHPDALTLSRGHVLPRCVRWKRLWREETTFPPREEVRENVVRMRPGTPGEACRPAG